MRGIGVRVLGAGVAERLGEHGDTCKACSPAR